jgi:rubrerythrin
MSQMFVVSEVVAVAVEDEKSGVAFYSALAGKAKDAALKRTFANLAEQERYHQQRFEKMLKDLGDYKPPDSYADEYVTYLRTLMTQRAFPDEAGARRAAVECPDDRAAVETSIRFERDTLILMGEMRGMVRPKDRPIVEQLMDEERAHLVVLGEARKRLAR